MSEHVVVKQKHAIYLPEGIPLDIGGKFNSTRLNSTQLSPKMQAVYQLNQPNNPADPYHHQPWSNLSP